MKRSDEDLQQSATLKAATCSSSSSSSSYPFPQPPLPGYPNSKNKNNINQDSRNNSLSCLTHLYSCGQNEYGELGFVYDTENKKKPTKVDFFEPTFSGIALNTSGGGSSMTNHSITSATKGLSIYDDPCTNQHQTTHRNPNLTNLDPSQFKWRNKAVNINKVCCGNEFTAVLDDDGFIYTCGYNESGQRGILLEDQNSSINAGDGNISKHSNGKLNLEMSDTLLKERKLDSTTRIESGTEAILDLSFRRINTLIGTSMESIYSGNGSEHMAAVTKRKGEAFFWGNNEYGQCGLGHCTRTVKLPKQLPYIQSVSTVSCGYYHTILTSVCSQGYSLLYGFGRNDVGQLGLGHVNSPIMTPTLINPMFLYEYDAQTSESNTNQNRDHSNFRNNENSNQVPTTTTLENNTLLRDTTIRNNNLPSRTRGSQRNRSNSGEMQFINHHNIFAQLNSNRERYTSTTNLHGGNPNSNSNYSYYNRNNSNRRNIMQQSYQQPFQPTRGDKNAGKVDDIASVACGQYFTIIVTSLGHVFGTGQNDFGQCGYRPRSRINHLPDGIVRRHQQQQGQLNDVPQRGIDTEIDNASDIQEERIPRTTNNDNINTNQNNENRNVECYFRKIVVSADTNPMANINEVSSGTTLQQNISNQGFIRFKAVACGYSHTILLSEEGGVYSCGRNDYGQLGLGHKENTFSPTLIKDLCSRFIVKIACGAYHTLTLSSEGKVSPFGRNNFGQLGVGNNFDSTRPLYISSLAACNIIDIQAGFYHSIFLARPMEENSNLSISSNFGISSEFFSDDKKKINNNLENRNLQSISSFASNTLCDEEETSRQDDSRLNNLKTTNVSLHDRHEYIKSKTKENTMFPLEDVESFPNSNYTSAIGLDLQYKNDILPQNTSSQAMASRGLAQDMRRLVNNPQRADIVFIVEDGNANFHSKVENKTENEPGNVINSTREELHPNLDSIYDSSDGRKVGNMNNIDNAFKNNRPEHGNDGDSMLEEESIYPITKKSENIIKFDLNESEGGCPEMEKEGKRLIYAHRCILMARCELFASMFENGMAESFQREFIMEGISFEVMLAFLEYIYTDEVGLLDPIDIKINDHNSSNEFSLSLGSKNNLEKFQSLINSKGNLQGMNHNLLSKETGLPKSLEKQLNDILDLYTLADIYLLPDLKTQIMKHFELKYFNVSMIGYLLFGIYRKENDTVANDKERSSSTGNISTIFEQLKIQILHYIVVHTYNWFGYKHEFDPYKMTASLFKDDYTYSEEQNLKGICGLEEFIYDLQDVHATLGWETACGRNINIEKIKYDNYNLWKFHVCRTSHSLWPYKMPQYFDDLMRSLLELYTKTLTGFEQSMGSLRDVYSFHPSNLYRRYLINHVSVTFPSSKGKDGIN